MLWNVAENRLYNKNISASFFQIQWRKLAEIFWNRPALYGLGGEPFIGNVGATFETSSCRLEQFQNEIALAAAWADARRKGVSAIYLRG